MSKRSLDRAAHAEPRIAPYPRRRIAAAPPAAASSAARVAVESFGVDPVRPMVAIDAALHRGVTAGAVEFLRERGFAVERVGDGSRPSVVELFLVTTARFVVCASPDLQRLLDLTHTPYVRVSAADPFDAYPVHTHSFYALSTAIDLDTGRVLPIAERLTDGYFRNLRNIGHRASSPAEVAQAVREMATSLETGWSETSSQARYRARLIATGAALAERYPRVAAWGPDEGFIGHGRLVAFQAEQAA